MRERENPRTKLFLYTFHQHNTKKSSTIIEEPTERARRFFYCTQPVQSRFFLLLVVCAFLETTVDEKSGLTKCHSGFSWYELLSCACLVRKRRVLVDAWHWLFWVKIFSSKCTVDSKKGSQTNPHIFCTVRHQANVANIQKNSTWLNCISKLSQNGNSSTIVEGSASDESSTQWPLFKHKILSKCWKNSELLIVL